MEIPIFRVYFITFHVEVMEGRKKENQVTRTQGIDFDGKGILNRDVGWLMLVLY